MLSFRSMLAAFAASCALPLAAQVTFTSQTYVPPSGTAPGITVAADMDRDGYPDLIATDDANSQLLIYYGTGGGNFAAAQLVPYAGGVANDLRVGDFNGDGKLDIVVVCASGKTIVVLTNNGDRTFSSSAISTADPVYVVAVGDFNGDGKLDFAASLMNSGSNAEYIQIYLGKGDGTFTAGATLTPTTLYPSARLMAADLNKDGKIDLVNVAGSATTIFLNNGDGTFTSAQIIVPQVPKGKVGAFLYGDLGDTNGDAVPDLLFTDNGFCGEGCGYVDTLDSYLNDGTGHFTLKQQQVSQGLQVDYGQLADLNYDFRKDVFYETYYSGGQLGYGLGNNNGTFKNLQLWGLLNSDGPPLTSHDLNNDGQMDLVSTSWSNLMVMLNTTATPDCGAPNSSSLASNICSPLSGQLVGNSVSIRAASNGPVDILRMEEWVDSVKKYQQLSNQLKNRLVLANGAHTLSIVAVDVLNNVSKTKVAFNVCGAPAGSVKICAPVASSTVTSPVSVMAAATASSGTSITAMRLYVDNVSEFTVTGGLLSTSVVLPSGSHNLVVVGYEANGGALQSAETITVQ